MPDQIYVLLLEEEKYYVGKTDQPLELRFHQHERGYDGSAWTRQYPPIEIVHHYERTGEFDEDNEVKRFMLQYGFENVRGGTYSQIMLPPDVLIQLEKEFCTAEDACFDCGGKGHFSKTCPRRLETSQPEGRTCRGTTSRNLSCQGYKLPAAVMGAFGRGHSPPAAHWHQDQNQQSRYPAQFSDAAPGSVRSQRDPHCCRGVKKDGAQCQNCLYLNSDGYCQLHKNQYQPVPSQQEPQCCRGKEQDGTRCQDCLYLNSDGYCQLHINQYQPPSSYPAPYPVRSQREPQCCLGVKKDGRQCQGKNLDSDGYCQWHQDQNQPATYAAPTAQRCLGVKQDGRQCQGKNLDSDGYCQWHQDQYQTSSFAAPYAGAAVRSQRESQCCLGVKQDGRQGKNMDPDGYCQWHQDRNRQSRYPAQFSVAAAGSVRDPQSYRGTNQDGTRCQKRSYLGSDSSYPAPYAGAAGRSVRSQQEPQSCRGTNQDGTRCQKRSYLGPDGFCNVHKDQYQHDRAARPSKKQRTWTSR
jgi:hypothetical protein